ncbi:MAG: hypothetical protein NTW03_10365 [Verrucomicrobia bacterium]|nr:hypothetical protein [Verrucomicrobiota bacterium]
MNKHTTDVAEAIAPWKKIPAVLAALGGLGMLAALVAAEPKQLGFSYLLSFMFFLSLSLGGLFLVLLHHLFDAAWSVPVRRVTEHMACLAVVLAALFIPLAFLSPHVYPWMAPANADHALQAKAAYLNRPFFFIRAAVFFAIWIGLAWRLRYWSLQQDVTGAAACTYKMRRLAAGGIFLFAITLTLAGIDWMKSLQHQWFSTMYGVYYFAGSVWLTLATLYLIAAWLKQAGPLRGLIQPRQLHDLGVLLFAFTVFYAYIHFSQYFIIWNANLPEETFWYAMREKGYWWGSGMVLVFGHFLLPFLRSVMVPLCLWAWLMHFVDMSFNVLPPLHLEDFPWRWSDLACFLFIGGVMSLVFLRSLAAHPVYPLKDPRLKEAMAAHEVPPPAIAESVHSHKG